MSDYYFVAIHIIGLVLLCNVVALSFAVFSSGDFPALALLILYVIIMCLSFTSFDERLFVWSLLLGDCSVDVWIYRCIEMDR